MKIWDCTYRLVTTAFVKLVVEICLVVPKCVLTQFQMIKSLSFIKNGWHHHQYQPSGHHMKYK